MTVIIKVGRREWHQKNTQFKFFILFLLCFQFLTKRSQSYLDTVSFPFNKDTKTHSHKHHLFLFTTLIILTFYHFLTFRLQIHKNRNDIDSIANLFIPLFSIYLSPRTSQKQQKLLFIQHKHNNKKLYAA